MATATSKRSDKPSPNGSGPGSRRPARLNAGRRRRPAVVASGVALIAVGAAVAASAALSAGAKHDVLALRRSVPAGRTLTAADLRSVRVAADASVATVPAAAESSVVGQRTSVDLVAGSLLSTGELGGTGVPGSGQALLGVAFKPGQLPARPLVRGDQAELVTTSANPTATNTAFGGVGGTGPTVVPVTVDAEQAPATDGTTVVDLVLAADVAPKVAGQAAAGQLVLVLLPRAGS
jgi:SAF domain